MRRAPFHLLLILSLVFNAVAAPWAMARMQHGPHASGGATPQTAAQHAMATVDLRAPHIPAPHAGVHGHAGHAAQMAAEVDQVDTPKVGWTEQTHEDGHCCDGAMCACGCILPPAVPFAALPVLAPPAAMPSYPARPQSTVAVHGTPPFRPPAA